MENDLSGVFNRRPFLAGHAHPESLWSTKDECRRETVYHPGVFERLWLRKDKTVEVHAGFLLTLRGKR
jgi:hypothetical protein